MIASAVRIGPLVLAAPRFAAIVGIVVFLLVAHLAGRARPRLRDEAWTLVALVVAGARLGFVATNAGAYLEDPLTVFSLWQGGFSPAWGLAAAVAYVAARPALRRAGFVRAVAPAALAGLLAWGGTGALLAPAASAEVRLPAVPLERLGGDALTLEAVAAGRPLVVNLWAPWCPPCRRETPMIVETAARHPGVAFALVDQGSAASEVRAFLREEALGGEDVLLDAGGRLGRELGAVGLPTTLVFDGEGVLRHAHVGEISRAELERRVRQAAAAP